MEESLLEYIKKRSKADKYFWIAFRLDDVSQNNSEFPKKKAYYQEYLRECGFEIPFLKHNMRNPSYVANSFDKFPGSRLKAGPTIKIKTMVDMAILPQNTVQGMRTVVVPVVDTVAHSECRLSDSLLYVLKKYFEDPKEPVVVLWNINETDTTNIKSRIRIEEHNDEGRLFLIYPFRGLETDTNNIKSRMRIKEYNDESRLFLVYPFRGPKVQSDVINQLEDYIKSPKGVLVTDAEASYGMQCRNIVIISSGTIVERNFIMRSNSFVVCILHTRSPDIIHHYRRISKDQDIIYDMTFLN